MITPSKETVLQLIELKPSAYKWHVPLYHAACIGTPLLVCLLINKFEFALMATIPTLVALYYPEKSTTANRMLCMFLCSFGMILSVAIGLLFSFSMLWSIVVFGVFSAAMHWLSNFYKLHNPRSFFFIMSASVAFCIPATLESTPQMIGLVALGTISTCIISFIYSLIIQQKDESHTNVEIEFDKSFDPFQSIIVGVFMSISMFIAFYFGIDKPYWVPIACLTILQGVSFSHVKMRSIHRVVGTTIGIGIVWLLSLYISSPLAVIIAIMSLQFIVGSLIPRNYGLAVMFITPLTILLADFNPDGIGIPIDTMTARLTDNILGCILGLIGGWIIYRRDKVHLD